MAAQISIWTGPLKTEVDLLGPDSPGAQPWGAVINNAPIALSAGGGALAVPARPSTAPAVPTFFLASTAGNQATASTFTAPVPHSPAQAGDYVPGDIIRFAFTKAQLAAANVTIVDGGSGTPDLTVLLNASVGTYAGAYADIQLNTAGTHWIWVGGGYN